MLIRLGLKQFTGLLIDVHCHLTAEEFHGKVERVIADAARSGVKIIITSGLGYEDCLKALEISDHQIVFPSLGIAPYKLEDYEKVLSLIEKERSRILAIGEVGLDYWKGKREEWSKQQKVFEDFIDLAKSLDLPLVVHSRSAGKYALEILFKKRVDRVIMHAFDGKATHAARAAERGFMFSIPPTIARSSQKQKLVKRLPLDNLLLESDAPVLSPIPGEINYPRNVRISAEWISRLKNLTFDKVAEKTTLNAMEVFDLKIQL